MQPWNTTSKRTILIHSKWLTVEEHTVRLPDGRVIPDWPWVITPEYVNVLPVTDEGVFLCFRQTKYAVHGVTLAPIGGYINQAETPLSAAQRELLEETGYEAKVWTSLGRYTVDGNHGAGMAHLFLAQGAHSVTTPIADDLEEQELLRMNLPEIELALTTGQFKVLSWTALVALALVHLRG